MKKFLSIFATLVALHVSAALQAQTTLDQFDFIADQAEALYPEEFPTGPETFSAQELGYSWYARFYPQTGIYIALNIDEGTIYTFGGPWPEPTEQGTLQGILDFLGYVPPSGGGGDTGGGDTGGGQNVILTQGSESCVDLTSPRQGLVASYAGTQSAGGFSTEISFTTTYTAVSANSITTSTEYLASGTGFSSSSSSVTTNVFERMGGWLLTSETNAEFTTTTTSPAGQNTLTSTTNLVFDPSQGSSPETICDGMIFRIASVTSTSTGTSGGVSLPASSAPTDETEVEVFLFEELSVPGGTFPTVRQITKGLNDDGEVDSFFETWFINGEGGVPARIDFYESSNGVDTRVSTIELQSIN